MNVLIIDDEQMIREMLKQALTRVNFTVDTAADAWNGILKFESGTYDLVITDVRMPGVDGRKVLNHIRDSKKDRTPVIGVSGTPWLLRSGDFNEVLNKPFSLQDLIDKAKALTKTN